MKYHRAICNQYKLKMNKKITIIKIGNGGNCSKEHKFMGVLSDGKYLLLLILFDLKWIFK